MVRWMAGEIFWPLTERMRGRDTMRRFGALQQSDRAPAEVLREIQEAKLRRLLRVAAMHCPFHRDRFRAAGLDVEDPRLGLDALRALPMLTRDEVREHLEALTWRDCPGGPTSYNTGGSTGEPLTFHVDRARQSADWACRWRARSWWDVRPGDPEILLWGAPIELRAHDRLRAWRDRLLNQRLLSAFDMSPERMDAYLRCIQAYRPVCLYGYGSSLALLARHALERGRIGAAAVGDRLRAVFVTGEVLQEQDAEDMDRAFDAPVVNEYGCRDGGLLACACPSGGLHVPAEQVIVEIVDPHSPDGLAAAPGETGEVVVTHLENLAMPLIRYRVGDLARAADAPCRCGRAHPVLVEVQGRVTDQIICHDGRRMHALALIYVLREVEGIRQFRITQSAIDALDVELVTSDRFDPEAERRILSGLQARLGAHVAIRLHRRERITATASGKHACVVSHV